VRSLATTNKKMTEKEIQVI